MTDEKWENLIAMVEEKFGIQEKRTEKLDPAGEVEIVEFKGPLGKMKLERTTRPKVLDKKTTYSRRIGSNVQVDYVYSATEQVQTFKAYKWDEILNNWTEVRAEGLVADY